MFCVIQEIEKKKQNKNGYSKELLSDSYTFTIRGVTETTYTYCYSEERFKRDIKKAYRISIHESYRENGKVKKKQFMICTVDYYDLATGFFTLYDWGNKQIEKAAEELNIGIDFIYDLIDKKLEPLIEVIGEEFKKTEEFKVHNEHERITTIYAATKVNFNEKYGTTGNEYDKCYDVFGKLKNSDYLKKIQREFKERKEYEKKSRSYQERNYSNYDWGGFGSYSNSKSSNYNEDEQNTLKQFYRALSKQYHPDANPDRDTSKEMKLLNDLKSKWGI